MSPALILLFAFVGGSAVGNLYWAQPLLVTIAASFGVLVGTAATLITATQVGYAVGIVLIVPLGDVLNRRRLIPTMMGCATVALVGSALAPTFPVLLAGLAALGMTTVAGQLLIPLAGDLASPAQRGRVVGTVVSGVLTGILTSRTISGFVAAALGWRAIYLFAAALTGALALVMARVLPDEPARPRLSYGRLLASVATVVGRHRAAQATLAMGAAGFAVFSLFWTGLTFLLSAPPFSYSLNAIGLVGLVGLAGAIVAQRVGILHDKGYSAAGAGAALLLALLSLGIAWAGAHSLGLILAAVLLLDIAIQAANVLNQTRLFAIDPAARSRLNTAFIAVNFAGGAIGSALAGVLWDRAGWGGLMAAAMALIATALLVWATQRRVLAAVRP